MALLFLFVPQTDLRCFAQVIDTDLLVLVRSDKRSNWRLVSRRQLQPTNLGRHSFRSLKSHLHAPEVAEKQKPKQKPYFSYTTTEVLGPYQSGLSSAKVRLVRICQMALVYLVQLVLLVQLAECFGYYYLN